MGLSGGGPYALATAYALPSTMLSSVGLFANGPNWEAGRNDMTWFRRLASLMAVYWPSGLEMVLNATVASVRWVLQRRWVKRVLEKKLEALKESRKPSRRVEGRAINGSQFDPQP
ncbi:hypothetical protein J3459_015747 [Metarhizium acridum]|nr:hypothetical protein J3458_015446 [Metarhizium acridum]KAG8413184.1 hypothetical protein J3459_015747 [Metarhizium acridum]